MASKCSLTEPDLATWRALGERRRLLGHELFVLDSGEDPRRETVLLIHGFPTSSFDWSLIWQQLTRTHRVLALDLLGFGDSDKPPGHDYTIAEQADLCQALIELAGVRSLHVVAHDYGVTVAQELLARQNAGRGVGRWCSLFLLNGGLFPETHRPRLIQSLLLTPLGPLITRLSGKRLFERNLRAVFGPDTPPSAEMLAGYWDVLNAGGRRAPVHSLMRYLPEREQHRERWVRALQESVVPIGLLNGSLDPVSGSHLVARYRALIPREDFIDEADRLGHFPQVEDPARFLKSFEAFLASVPTAL
ncbi:MAG: alpha/beta hydrolase [Pseudomonadota bacterium]